MNPKKQKAKDRRRARVLAEQAWEAVNQGNLDLAEKIIRRAVSTQEDNPVLWNDQGVILGLRHKDSEVAKSFAAALSLAPKYADPYAHLANLSLRQDKSRRRPTGCLQTQAASTLRGTHRTRSSFCDSPERRSAAGSRARPRRCGAVLQLATVSFARVAS
jgi:predicted Zn-dependent protease